MEFNLVKKLPPYVFALMTELKMEAVRSGEDIIDMNLGNPDRPTPDPIVNKLITAARDPRNHRYSVSKGIRGLRLAITDWYRRRYGVELDPETEAIVTMGSKEGIAHLVLALIDRGDAVLCPDPTYPIHQYSVIIAGGTVRKVPIGPGRDFFVNLEKAIGKAGRKPKALIINFPHNPTTEVVQLDFFQRVVDFACTHNLLVIHDLAYADLCFDGYAAPSFLQIPGARKVGVEFFTLSKSYNMPGWRVGFCVGNRDMIAALTRLKSYLDYGMFQPIQLAAIQALNGPRRQVTEVCETYRRRRDVLVSGLDRVGWQVDKPQATMFVWARIPSDFKAMGSLEFAKFLIREAKLVVSPGIGFGSHGDQYVRFALVEDERRIRQAVRGIARALGGQA